MVNKGVEGVYIHRCLLTTEFKFYDYILERTTDVSAHSCA